MKKKIIIICCIVIAVLVTAVIIMSNGLSEGKNILLNDIDLSEIDDGSYTGIYEYGRWTNTLIIHVENNRITGIDIKKDVFGAGVTDCSGEVFQRVIEAQSTQIDVVAGATVTSKAYLKAIENALKK